jgi:hypothetical protein
MSGAFSLGVLQAVVNGGQCAKSRLTDGTSSDRGADLRRIENARSAKETMESILESNGYYDGPGGPGRREMRNHSFDEVLRGEVEVFVVDGCPECLEHVGKIRGVCRPAGFRVRVTPVDEAVAAGGRWVLDVWPHIEVGGREVSLGMLEDLVVDAGWIRSTNRQGGAGDV